MPETKSVLEFKGHKPDLITLSVGDKLLKSFTPENADEVDIVLQIIERKKEDK